VSDRAKGLINLAQKKFQVKSIADLFHLKYCINKLLTLALSSKLTTAQVNLAQAKTKENPQAQIIECKELAYGQIQFYTDLYVESVQNISHHVHAFYAGNSINKTEMAKSNITNEIEKIKQVVVDCDITDKYKLLEKAENQVEDVANVIDLWQDMVSKQIKEKNIDTSSKIWFQQVLLPQTYWTLFIQKTKHKPTLDRLKNELNLCRQKENEMDKYQVTDPQQLNNLRELASDLCKQFQRSSSQVEGRNGYLSMINHTQRGFDKKRIDVLTVVHNFDIKGIDGKTPAQRLFKNQIEHISIFDYLVENTNSLALPRNRKIKVIDYQFCPTLCG